MKLESKALLIPILIFGMSGGVFAQGGGGAGNGGAGGGSAGQGGTGMGTPNSAGGTGSPSSAKGETTLNNSASGIPKTKGQEKGASDSAASAAH